MIVLVTGSSGFVGRQVLAALEDRHDVEVHGTSRGRPPAPWVHQVDLLRATERRQLLDEVQPDLIVHLAWTTEHGLFWEDATNATWAAATAQLAGEAAERGTQRFVGTGSCAEYDWSILGPADRCSEYGTPRRPATTYGQAKLEAAASVEAVAAASGMSQAWAILFSPFGPGEDRRRLVPSVACGALAGDRVAVTGGGSRDFMDVRDTGRALAHLALGAVQGRVNVASGSGTAPAELARLVAGHLGRADLVDVGGLADRPGEPAALVADIGRLRDEVGFRPLHSLATAAADAADWWRAQGC